MDEPSLFGMPAAKGRWLLVLCGMLINLCLGSIYAWSVFVAPLTAHFTESLGREVTATEVLMPFSVFLLVFAVTMPLAGRLIESLGPAKTAALGGVLTGLGWIFASFAGSVEALYLGYGVVGGVGVGIAYGVPVAVSTRWFPDRRGLAVGLTVLGFGFSAVVTANLAGLLIEAVGVMATFRVFGLAFLLLLVILALPLSFPPGQGLAATGVAACEFDRGRMLRTRAFYGLWGCYFIGCLAGLMAISIARPVGTEVAGIEPALATALVGFFAVFNGGGRPLFGAFTDRFTPRAAAMLSFFLIGAASLAMWWYPVPATYVVAFALLWGCLGGWLALAPAATAQFFGTCDYPRCYGVVFLAYGAGALAGPQFAGLVRTTTGGYLGVFPVVAVLALVGLVTAFALLRPPSEAPG
ncbi:MFS transporter [Methanofollis formosanus]|uniref:MFS transporter n=1 Tax=Methanofollis formosanus TaxID=299308 RepID=A0A8G1A1R8_9EURY|nr:OFA family MFS transporter [Methanofollis formosanus]QYZ79475.1 MFS transporter [Methanofollis formosanus]